MSKKQSKGGKANQPATDQTLVVGIGASAGGVEALTEFFKQVVPHSGLAYVVILHLSPDYDSQLTEILQSVTPLPVIQVTETVPVQADHVYVVPPNRHLQMQDGHLTVLPNARLADRRAPVDIFLRTLAESHGPRAVGVILSGTGANGSMGLKRIKENGGVVFVQNPREAAFNEMPRHAIATDLVDDILPVAQIPARLRAYRQGLGTVASRVEAGRRTDDHALALREVFTQLRLRTGHDFSNYKRPTLMRRLERRIRVRNLPGLPAYAAFLGEHPGETQALLKDLLISVTNFFRDGPVFTALEQDVLPLLTQEKKADNTLRIWVAGCATGEEAYSLAILLAEQTTRMVDAPKVQIFATDIDEAAIATAREGRYTLNDAADVSPERLRQFFTREGDDYRIRHEIREMILFAHHNVLKDPPFSRLDLISCRNLLIYLNQAAQERVMETFHFSLKSGGYLLLGQSETADGAVDLFATLSRAHHLYQSRQVATRPFFRPETTPPRIHRKKRPSEPAPEPESQPVTGRPNYGDLHQQLLEQYAPPSIIVNQDYDILHLTERAGRYLHIGGGEPSKNLLKLIRPELRLELRTAFYQATQQQTNVEARHLKVRLDDKTQTLTIHVRPVVGESHPARGFLLVLFEPTDETNRSTDSVLTSQEPVARHLEEELIRVKAQLRASNEQHETQAEELKASNEELQAMNEELRSAAEELETSKEELQSINEELITVNQELKVKVEEISLTSNNFQNLINSTDLATLFLDRRLRVNLFTPATRTLFNLIPADVGRPLTDITNRLAYAHLQTDAEAVLSKLQPIEREVQTTDDRVFIMRVLPYRTAEDRINGVVLTFVDITDRKAAEEALARSEEKYRTLFDSIDEGFCLLEIIYDGQGAAIDARYHDTNRAFERQTGLANAEGKTAHELIPNLEPFWIETYDNVARMGEPARFENYVRGTDHWFNVYASRVGGAGSNTVALVFNDITGRKRQEANLAFLAEVSLDLVRLTNIDETMNRFGAKIGGHFKASRCAFFEFNQAVDEPGGLEAVCKYDWHRADGPSLAGIYRLADDPTNDFGRILGAGETFVTSDINADSRVDARNLAALRIAAGIVIPVLGDKQLQFVLCLYDSEARDWRDDEIELTRELTNRIWSRLERARAEVALRESEQRLASIRPLTLLGQTEELAQVGSWEYHPSTGQFTWSAGMYRLFALPPQQPIQPDTYLDFVVDEDRIQAQRLVSYLYQGEGHFEGLLRIRVGDQDKTLRIKADVIGAGDQKRVLGVDLDITEQLQAQHQIRQSAENLQAVLDASPACIGLLKAVHGGDDNPTALDFELAVGNQKLAEFFGEPLEQLLGQPARYFSTLLWDGHTLDFLRQVYHTHQPRYNEKHLGAASADRPGPDRWLGVAVSRQDDGVVLTGLDVTELKQAQAQQQYWLSELEQASQSAQTLAQLRDALQQRGELLRSASHDLRGQVGVVASAAQLLGMAGSEADRSLMIQMIQRNIGQMTQLMTNLLDFARLEAGQEVIQPSHFDVAPLFGELVAGMQPLAAERGLWLKAEGPPELAVDSDSVQVRRIAQNLLLNALKYTQAGGVTIRWHPLENGLGWQLRVTDTGPGLPAQQLARLSGEAGSPASGGAGGVAIKPGSEGIGLAIVKRLCVLLGGRLEVESQAGEGTRFTLTFGEITA